MMKKTLLIGRRNGGGKLLVEMKMEKANKERMTIHHTNISSYTGLVISVFLKIRNGKQSLSCEEVLEMVKKGEIREWLIAEEDVMDMLHIGKEYSMNDMKAGCTCMEPVTKEKAWDKEEWNRLSEQCKYGYRYGSQWLVKELPEQEEKRMKEIFA